MAPLAAGQRYPRPASAHRCTPVSWMTVHQVQRFRGFKPPRRLHASDTLFTHQWAPFTDRPGGCSGAVYKTKRRAQFKESESSQGHGVGKRKTNDITGVAALTGMLY